MKKFYLEAIAVGALVWCAGCSSKPEAEPAVEVPVQAATVEDRAHLGYCDR